MNEIKMYDFVTIKGSKSYMFISSIDEDDEVSLIGMTLNENKDSIIFYETTASLNEIKYLEEYFVNLAGPLAQLREDIINGNANVYYMNEAV